MNRYIFKLIAACEIVGAMIGLLILYQAVRSANYDADLLLIFALLLCSICVVAILALVAGVLLWKHRRLGLWLSVLVQVLQVPFITSSILKFQLMYGIGVWGYFGFDEQFKVGMSIKFGAAENVSFHPDLPLSVGANVVAVFFMYVLLRELLGRPRAPAADLASDG